MVALASLVVVILLSLVITRVATVALTLTGMSRESARFQARSALSGVGFTTSEAEGVVNHPVRRRIVMALMLLGSAGLVTVVTSLILSMANAEPAQRSERLAIVLAALVTVWLLARSQWVDRNLSRLISRGLRRFTSLDARDYAALLRLAEDFAVSEMAVGENSWVAGSSLRQLELRDEGVIVLGVSRADGSYEGAPGFATVPEPGDTLIVYGPADRLAEIDQREQGPGGDRQHRETVAARSADQPV